MPDFDVEAFITKLDRMGMKLTAVPLADGKLRVSRWRMLNACEHAQQIQDLWSTQIGNDQERIDVLAAHLDKAASKAAGYSISFDRMRISSQSNPIDVQAPPGAQKSPGLHVAPARQTAATTQATASAMPAGPPVRSGLRVPTGTSRSGIMQAALDRLKPAGPESVSVHGAAGLQKVAGTPSSGSLQNAIAHISTK
jgi:hypothetical protein